MREPPYAGDKHVKSSDSLAGPSREGVLTSFALLPSHLPPAPFLPLLDRSALMAPGYFQAYSVKSRPFTLASDAFLALVPARLL